MTRLPYDPIEDRPGFDTWRDLRPEHEADLGRGWHEDDDPEVVEREEARNARWNDDRDADADTFDPNVPPDYVVDPADFVPRHTPDPEDFPF
jgi:hypothetical protein